MSKISKRFLCFIITVVCLIVLVGLAKPSAPALAQGNGDNWGVDIFTDDWQSKNQTITVNKTTLKKETTTKEKITTKKVSVKRVVVKKVVIKQRTAKVYLTALKNVSGYKVKFSTSSKFTKAKTKSLSVKKARITIKKIPQAKKYYVKARAYKKTGGKIYYGKWSKIKSLKK